MPTWIWKHSSPRVRERLWHARFDYGFFTYYAGSFLTHAESDVSFDELLRMPFFSDYVIDVE
jgi:hypothetical protein